MEAENMSCIGNLSKNQPKEAKAQFVLKLYEIVEVCHFDLPLEFLSPFS